MNTTSFGKPRTKNPARLLSSTVVYRSSGVHSVSCHQKGTWNKLKAGLRPAGASSTAEESLDPFRAPLGRAPVEILHRGAIRSLQRGPKLWSHKSSVADGVEISFCGIVKPEWHVACTEHLKLNNCVGKAPCHQHGIPRSAQNIGARFKFYHKGSTPGTIAKRLYASF